MANTKPLVNLACICERAIQEKDGVFTLIRVIDTAFVDMDAVPQGGVPGLQYSLVVSLKSGDIKGTFRQLSIIHRSISGEEKSMTDGPIETVFNGGAHGYYVNATLRLAVERLGLGWFDVKWGDEVLTSVPLELKPIAEAPKA